MVEILKRLFEANPDKSTVEFKDKCLNCRDDVIIHIKLTSVGFGLQGGALLDRSPNGHLTICFNCYKINPEIKDFNRSKHVIVH
jgi:hypothetical protein